MKYHKTRDLLHVKKLLGHKNIQSTMIYVNLEAAIFTDRTDEFHVAVAKNVEEASNLVKAGFEYVTESTMMAAKSSEKESEVSYLQ